MRIDLRQAELLLEMFGGEDCEIELTWWTDGHSGEGLYAYYSEYPEDGATYLGYSKEQQYLSDMKKQVTGNGSITVDMKKDTQ